MSKLGEGRENSLLKGEIVVPKDCNNVEVAGWSGFLCLNVLQEASIQPLEAASQPGGAQPLTETEETPQNLTPFMRNAEPLNEFGRCAWIRRKLTRSPRIPKMRRQNKVVIEVWN